MLIYTQAHRDHQILGHLRPLDILHLARTTKEFRQILLHKSSISVWKAARANVPDLPDRFPDDER